MASSFPNEKQIFVECPSNASVPSPGRHLGSKRKRREDELSIPDVGSMTLRPCPDSQGKRKRTAVQAPGKPVLCVEASKMSHQHSPVSPIGAAAAMELDVAAGESLSIDSKWTSQVPRKRARAPAARNSEKPPSLFHRPWQLFPTEIELRTRRQYPGDGGGSRKKRVRLCSSHVATCEAQAHIPPLSGYAAGNLAPLTMAVTEPARSMLVQEPIWSAH